MKTSVVIATKNSARTIEECLASLMPYHEQGYISERVVVDGHSSDGTLDILKKYPVKLAFDAGDVEGSSAAYDIGWHNTQSELVLFLDSDAYLGDGFFPRITEFFREDDMGIVGAEAQTVVSNQLSRTVAQWGTYHGDKMRKIQGDSSLSWFERLYRRGLGTDESQVAVTGPCFLVRRRLLEAVNGFRPPQKGRPLPKRLQEDYLLSRRITATGNKAAWWLDAPVHHYPRFTFNGLERQHFRLGKGNAFTERYYFQTPHPAITLLKYLLGAPVVGLICTLRFRNLRHLLLFPLTKYAQLAGYLYGLAVYGKTKTEHNEKAK